MELRHLRCFAAVAETCHFGLAAQRLHVAQPALSHTIRQLEAEIGAPLFTRTTRQVALTPAGEFFSGEVRRLLAGLEASIEGVRRIADGRSGLIRLGVTGTAAASHLPAIARAIKAQLPDVALEVKADLLTPMQCEGLRSGALDLAVLRPPIDEVEFETGTLEEEPLVLALPDGHPRAGRGPIALDLLREESFVLYSNPDSAVNAAARRACRSAGFLPRRENEAGGTGALLALVAAGLGIALVPASARAQAVDGVTFTEVVDAPHVELCLAWRRGDDNPLLATVLATLLGDAGTASTPSPVATQSPDPASTSVGGNP